MRPKRFYRLDKAERLERWVALYDALGKLSRHESRKHWDMGEWGLKTRCGTIACAAGHASLNPDVNKLGFVGTFDKEGYIKFNVDPDDFFGSVMYDRVFTGMDGPLSMVRRQIKVLIGQLRSDKTTGDVEEDEKKRLGEALEKERQQQEERI